MASRSRSPWLASFASPRVESLESKCLCSQNDQQILFRESPGQPGLFRQDSQTSRNPALFQTCGCSASHASWLEIFLPPPVVPASGAGSSWGRGRAEETKNFVIPRGSHGCSGQGRIRLGEMEVFDQASRLNPCRAEIEEKKPVHPLDKFSVGVTVVRANSVWNFCYAVRMRIKFQ